MEYGIYTVYTQGAGGEPVIDAYILALVSNGWEPYSVVAREFPQGRWSWHIFVKKEATK